MRETSDDEVFSTDSVAIVGFLSRRAEYLSASRVQDDSLPRCLISVWHLSCICLFYSDFAASGHCSQFSFLLPFQGVPEHALYHTLPQWHSTYTVTHVPA